jgi:Holliday junction resolvase RusA-like endonuclease
LQDYDRSWVPLTLDRIPYDIQKTLKSEFPIGSDLRGWVIAEFEKQCSVAFDPVTWSVEAATLFRKWWWYQYEKGDFAIRKRPVLQNMLHLSLSAKASSLSQRHCQVCSGMLPADSQFPISILPIRITPQSRQALKKIKWEAFQAAMKAWFDKRVLAFGPSKHFCITLTYVLSDQQKDRDLDNMTKALMDAFSRAIGFNDKDIHHLDVLKLIGETDEECVFIKIAPSYLQDISTVMIPIYDSVWAVGEALQLQDYMEKS